MQPRIRHRTRASRLKSTERTNRPDWRTTATTIGGILSVLLVAAGLFYTNGANRQQQELGLQQQNLALQGQVADRFTAAIDQLGQEDEKKQDKLSIRLGGIYALQRLMIDSPPDQPAVVQVLCAFVRTHAPRPDQMPKRVRPSSADVRAAVTVLSHRPNPGNQTLDFSGTLLGLDTAELRGADLIGADLTGADLRYANLTGANLDGANLDGTDLDSVHLDGADLRYADLDGANLTGADLRYADLTGTPLTGANLRYANLTGANLDGADLASANLDGANLASANLHDADLSGADLHDADLSGAHLDGANLQGMRLDVAHLDGADLDGADLTYADLTGADLSRVVGLTSIQIVDASMDKTTKLPKGVEQPTPSPH
ncbi:pentapeptide repeat-containing protein [Winogradskya humida]|uniref:pentapeptide repeat-containing protein n=1 Tax=Winogradskya humida TaxID=113566 RepID=UPI001940B3BC|nr:pentapeptide repeat-containing protein [Actinoplanes humidus]